VAQRLGLEIARGVRSSDYEIAVLHVKIKALLDDTDQVRLVISSAYRTRY